jgi:polysaccharide export outer membrane protein
MNGQDRVKKVGWIVAGLLAWALIMMGCGGPAKRFETIQGPENLSIQETKKQPTVEGLSDFTGEYRIGIGDILFISVWKDEELSRQVNVLPDGVISFPLVGQVRADGLQLAELKAVLTQRMNRFVPDAIISVQVLQVNSQVIYVIGNANRPGRYQLHGNINVLQALSIAGGLNPFARTRSIKIIRNEANGAHIYRFNFNQVADGKNLGQNIQLEKGDMIVVP